ncbi:MAG: FAD-binding protein [Firmicutes bacterium]|nr:FAD-binding protein [Bacillota bacterium]
MFTVGRLAQPNTIGEAYRVLTEERDAAILGGCAFLRMGSRKISTAIDLTNLGLKGIREHADWLEIGAMTTFRMLETDPLTSKRFDGVLVEAVKQVLGVQFRNLVTVGATVFSKYGFSDLIPALLVLETEVELANAGRITLETFLNRPSGKDILLRVWIRQDGRRAAYRSFRNSASDFPVLTAAVSWLPGQGRIVIGARPSKAEIAVKASQILSEMDFDGPKIDEIASIAAAEMSFGSNMRGSAEYRRELCKVLVKRAVAEVAACK